MPAASASGISAGRGEGDLAGVVRPVGDAATARPPPARPRRRRRSPIRSTASGAGRRRRRRGSSRGRSGSPAADRSSHSSDDRPGDGRRSRVGEQARVATMRRRSRSRPTISRRCDGRASRRRRPSGSVSSRWRTPARRRRRQRQRSWPSVGDERSLRRRELGQRRRRAAHQATPIGSADVRRRAGHRRRAATTTVPRRRSARATDAGAHDSAARPAPAGEVATRSDRTTSQRGRCPAEREARRARSSVSRRRLTAVVDDAAVRMRTMRWAASATGWSWVTSRIVWPPACRRRNSSSTSSPPSESSAPVGSSASSSVGSLASARAIASRWRWPPDSAAGACFALSPMPSRSSRSRARVSAGRALAAGDQRRHHHVLEHGHALEQVEELEDDADVLAAHQRQLALGLADQRLAGDGDLALVGHVEAGDRC